CGPGGREPATRCDRVGDENRDDGRGLQAEPGGVSPLLYHTLSTSNRRSGNARRLGAIQLQTHDGNAKCLREKIRGALWSRRGLHESRNRDQRDSRGRSGQSREAKAQREPEKKERHQSRAQRQAGDLFHPSRPKIHRHDGVRLRAAWLRRGGKRASGDGVAFYNDPGTARPQSHGGSVYEFGDASAVSRMEEWSDGATEWWNDGNPILQDSTIPMSKERRGYAAGLPANIGTGLVMFGDHERHAHLG